MNNNNNKKHEFQKQLIKLALKKFCIFFPAPNV